MKTPEMQKFCDDMAEKLFGPFSGKFARDNGLCVCCQSDKTSYDDFKDDLSRREFEINGMCAKCQDSVFNMDNNNE